MDERKKKRIIRIMATITTTIIIIPSLRGPISSVERPLASISTAKEWLTYQDVVEASCSATMSIPSLVPGGEKRDTAGRENPNGIKGLSGVCVISLSI